MNVWMGGGQKLASRANVLLLLQANAFVEEIWFFLEVGRLIVSIHSNGLPIF